MLPSAKHPTRELAQGTLFRTHCEGLATEDRVRLSYERAKAIGAAYQLTENDLITLSPKFWEMHTDPIWSMDGAAGTLITLQYNCCAGTIAMFTSEQPVLRDLLKDVLDFRVSGQFCLTEVGHGLDVIHLQTTATLLESGDFELDTPSESAAKYMPPTAPVGIPCLAVVFAQTIVHGENHGIKPFVVHLHDGKNMTTGVTCKLLPPRGGARPVNHSLTYFHRVRVPRWALMGSLAKPADPRDAFFRNISRVAVGTIAIGSLGVPALRVASCIAARYSMRRTVVDVDGGSKPIIAFRTQKTPIITALAQYFVMEAFHNYAIGVFCNVTVDARVRHAIGSILKVVMIQHAQTAHLTLGDRCGAQGLFEVNQLTAMHADMRGTAIAEGDLLAISIRLATELLLGRYSVPKASDSTALLSRRETCMFSELRGLLSEIPHHRSAAFDRMILPECLGLVQAIGHRMAYEAAVAANVDHDLIEVYVTSCVKLDSAWYVEMAGLSRAQQREMEASAIDSVFPNLEKYIDILDVDPYISAPFASDTQWKCYIDTLTTFRSDGENRS
ncbi:acyl-CoA dehydrogenase NM domain-like protein [Stereum hirsutum FP-91666 SS1]|uniref:acyl-CoA dehydrogenase NM domain-like protein n=1 Tax=Stereum hirsutum (strain FP-91666) TaxID=721885 RepID=UPI0004449409|nr:acyl-CoA dehydrogenase NM domain-like protein [Stereum hirsutum FP-91666 SS1]EIM84216.1 acyl-CoA dehydrogenase NM domain-like protein [Stereum hirsutum FP-91666 SS1]